nr:MAG TPA: hypothetical protein [Caudoviricetes sp.]
METIQIVLRLVHRILQKKQNIQQHLDFLTT